MESEYISAVGGMSLFLQFFYLTFVLNSSQFLHMARNYKKRPTQVCFSQPEEFDQVRSLRD